MKGNKCTTHILNTLTSVKSAKYFCHSLEANRTEKLQSVYFCPFSCCFLSWSSERDKEKRGVKTSLLHRKRSLFREARREKYVCSEPTGLQAFLAESFLEKIAQKALYYKQKRVLTGICHLLPRKKVTQRKLKHVG